MKALILYYSWSGNTAKLAANIGRQAHGDVLELSVPEATFSDDMSETSNIEKRQKETKQLPEITSLLPDLNEYDIILIGGPVWNGSISTPILSLLSQLPTGLTIAPFYTDAGTVGNYLREFKDLMPTSLSGFGGIFAQIADQSVTQWLFKLESELTVK